MITIAATTLTAAAIGAAVLTAPQAAADVGTDYGDTHAQAVCSTLESYPNFGGLEGVAQAIHQLDGLSFYEAGEAIREAVDTQCTQFEPLLQAFIAAVRHAGTEQA